MALAVIGLVGIIVYPRVLVLWVFFIFFGIAALPRPLGEWWSPRLYS